MAFHCSKFCHVENLPYCFNLFDKKWFPVNIIKDNNYNNTGNKSSINIAENSIKEKFMKLFIFFL